MTPEDYKSKLARAEELGALDPEQATPEGRELIALADELEVYERAHFPEWFVQKCDFCGKVFPEAQVEPEEGDLWACWWCLRSMAYEDDNVIDAAFWERAIKELECRRTT